MRCNFRFIKAFLFETGIVAVVCSGLYHAATKWPIRLCIRSRQARLRTLLSANKKSVKRFRAFRIESTDRATPAGRFVEMDETMLDAGDVLIRVGYAAVNHKDALAGSGRAPLIRRLPCVGGSDLAGVVVSSAAPRFRPGDAVIATGYELGLAHHGGFAEYALVPGGWVLPLPSGLSLAGAMAIGTAGLAAALAVTRMENNGLKPENGPVVVTGATGGVGSLAVDMLAGRGYEVVALTGKPELAEWLYQLGATRVMRREEIPVDLPCTADRRGQWAGAIDVAGGATLAWLAATSKPLGMVASVGAVSGSAFYATMAPFVSRGVGILGIDSVYAGFGAREMAWDRLCGDLHPRHLESIIRTIAFDELPNVFDKLIAALATGRTVVQIANDGNAKETP